MHQMRALLSSHRLQVILLQPKQQRLCDLDKSIAVDEHLRSCKALMGCAVAVEHVEGSTATVEDAPEIALLEVAGVGCAFCDLLPETLGGVLQYQVHLEVHGAQEILLFLLDLHQLEEVLALQPRTTLQQRLQPIQICLTCTVNHPHEVLPSILPALDDSAALSLHPEHLELLLHLLLRLARPHRIKQLY